MIIGEGINGAGFWIFNAAGRAAEKMVGKMIFRSEVTDQVIHVAGIEAVAIVGIGPDLIEDFDADP